MLTTTNSIVWMGLEAEVALVTGSRFNSAFSTLEKDLLLLSEYLAWDTDVSYDVGWQPKTRSRFDNRPIKDYIEFPSLLGVSGGQYGKREVREV